MLGLLVSGRRERERWPWPADEFTEYEDLKGLAEHLLTHLGLPEAQYASVDTHPYLSPCAEVTLNGTILGHLGRVRDEAADAYNARYGRVAGRARRRPAARRVRGPVPRLSPTWPSSRPCAATSPSSHPRV